jgi:hypothetical protein
MLAFDGERLGAGVRMAVVAVVVLAVAAHASHILLVIALLVAVMLEQIYQRWRDPTPATWRPLLWIGAPFAAGLAAVLMLSVVGVGEASVVPKRLPFVLARSIADGPGSWYLESHCPTRHFAVCPFFAASAKAGSDLLFGDPGLMHDATPAQMDAVRAEEMQIVIAATSAYPWVQIKQALGNIGRQFIRIDLDDIRFDFTIVPDSDGGYVLAPAAVAVDARRIGTALIYAGIALSLLGLAVLSPRLSAREWRILRVLLIGLAANAAITGALSAPAGRYQGRVIWVLPVIAAGFGLARRRPDEENKIQGPPVGLCP